MTGLRLLLVVPALILMLTVITSCTARKKSATQIEVAQPQPQLLPPKPVYEEGTPFVVVEEMPLFPGGDEALLKYIAENTKYPEDAKKRGVEGRIIIRFCVTEAGSVNRISILKGVDPELDTEAMRVIETLPAFSPGRQGGKSVPVWYMVPVTFTLK